MSTPNEIVGDRIVNALEAENILHPASTKGLAAKLSSGQLGSSDWVTLARLDTSNRKQNDQDKTQVA